MGCVVDTSFRRVTSFFPGTSALALRTVLRRIRTRINEAGEKIRLGGNDIFRGKDRYLEMVWRDVLPRDDSALAWSTVRAGITGDPHAALLRIYEKSVGLYKQSKDKDSRSDADVWGSIETHLNRVSLSKKVVTHHVQGRLSEYKFEHSLKNGQWHCIEPVSIDLVNQESIRGKVQKLFGAMSLIKLNADNLNVYFVLSDPTTAAAKTMFQEARDVVSSVDVKHQVFMENESWRLAEELATIIHH